MPNDQSNTPHPQNLDAIAATMIGPATPEDRQVDDQVEDTSQQDDGERYEGAHEGIEEAEAEDSHEAEASEDATDDEDADEAEESQAFPELTEVADDTVFSVTVDGEEVEATLADLKKAFSGEGAIAKRLQEVTETKRELETAKRSVEQELDAGRAKLVEAFKTFDHLMFQPSVPKPDLSLQRTDPQQYLIQMENYREDQARLSARRGQVQGAFKQYESHKQQQFDALKQENSQKLLEVLPDLKDPQKGPVLANSITETAQAYGFSPDEISNAVDYRLFQMAADAAAYRALKNKQKVQPQEVKPKTKVLRPGTAKAKQQTVKARQQQAVYRKAAQSGTIDDVAATMLQSNKR